MTAEKLLVLENVVISGVQIILSVAELREQEAIIEDVVCVIDREVGGKEKFVEEGLQLHSLFTMSELKNSTKG